MSAGVATAPPAENAIAVVIVMADFNAIGNAIEIVIASASMIAIFAVIATANILVAVIATASMIASASRLAALAVAERRCGTAVLVAVAVLDASQPAASSVTAMSVMPAADVDADRGQSIRGGVEMYSPRNIISSRTRRLPKGEGEAKHGALESARTPRPGRA